MSKRLIQDLHAGISRRDWSAVEDAANRLRGEIEKTIAILAGTGIGSLPNDYPLAKMAEDAAISANTLRELVERAQAIISTSTYPNWHGSAVFALRPSNNG